MRLSVAAIFLKANTLCKTLNSFSQKLRQGIQVLYIFKLSVSFGVLRKNGFEKRGLDWNSSRSRRSQVNRNWIAPRSRVLFSSLLDRMASLEQQKHKPHRPNQSRAKVDKTSDKQRGPTGFNEKVRQLSWFLKQVDGFVVQRHLLRDQDAERTGRLEGPPNEIKHAFTYLLLIAHQKMTPLRS